MADVSVVEETFRRLGANKGVEGVLVLNGDSIPIRSTMDNSQSVKYAGWVPKLVGKSRRAVQKLDHAAPTDELASIRVRTVKHEIIITPEFTSGHDYMLVAIQVPSTE